MWASDPPPGFHLGNDEVKDLNGWTLLLRTFPSQAQCSALIFYRCRPIDADPD